MRLGSALLRFVCFALALSTLGAVARIWGATFSEYEVKAAWLVNFARFVEWPESAFRATNAPLVVGVFGRDPFGKDLEKALEGQTVRGHPLLPRRLSVDADPKGCHILFIGAGERRRLRDLPDRLRGGSVLTVGETDEFLDQGGVVNFVLKDNAVRFEINVKAAQAARLRLDAKLLRVAIVVKGRYD